MFIHDMYVLGESDSFDIKMHEEAVVDLGLEKVQPCYHTLLTGKVLYKDIPIKDATIMVMDSKCSPISSTTSDEKGIYKFCNKLKPGKYKVIASAIGYVTSDTRTIFINDNEVTRRSFTLKKSSIFEKGIVYGKILEAGSGIPVKDACVCLKTLKCDGKTIYKTMSNHNGQYLIYNILPDNYKIIIQKKGYMATEPLLIKIEPHSRMSLYFDLIKKPNNHIISGTISFHKKPIPKATVFLYLLDKEKSEKIVQIQKTNENGLYLFTNVESGTYLVKGKLQNYLIYQKSFKIQ